MKHPNRLLPMWFAGTFAFLLIVLSTKVMGATEPAPDQIDRLRHDWAVAKYETPRNKQDDAFLSLIERAEALTNQYPNSAEANLWHGTILASYTAVIGGLSALKYAKGARDHLEKALQIDATVENGFAHGVIGALYARLPGWPIAFGDSKKARNHILTFMQMSPNGMDSNYYYGDFLLNEGQRDQAREHLLKAKRAKMPKGYEVAERGRLREIEADLNKLSGR